jgi:hypothetical protein
VNARPTATATKGPANESEAVFMVLIPAVECRTLEQALCIAANLCEASTAGAAHIYYTTARSALKSGAGRWRVFSGDNPMRHQAWGSHERYTIHRMGLLHAGLRSIAP